ncbi:guanylyl cyclase-activating protein 2-like [Clupea harengus]|uniref:Guanylyl cyclase-activating protein 2-like n=1 Tax=Clupea harengus TaxID=7950 RepID=A0A6P3W213_CLUHA|nr:guanylyl cyclase-activating protein 2-like [Clupea harengus]
MGQSESQEEDEQLDISAIQTLYKSFIMECPSGSLYLHEFKKIFGIKNDDSPESLYMDNLFRSFDMNGDDTLDFIEYVAALHLVLRGKLEDKLRWSFKVFDHDENGRLDKHELKRIIKIIYKMKQGKMADASGNSLTVDQVCDRLFDTIDKNGDGHISLEEFLEGAQNNPWVRNCLKLDVNPCAWVNRHQEQINGYKKPLLSSKDRLR